jgi:hypothetical protein
MEFTSDTGEKIPDSFQSGKNGWNAIPPPNFAGQSAPSQFNFYDGSSNTSKDIEENQSIAGEQETLESSSSFSGFDYNSLTGIAFGEFNSRIMDSFSQTQFTNAVQGRGPLGSSFNAERTAQQTLTNQHAATAVASLAMSAGGLFGPEGLAVGLVAGAAIDYATSQGAFDASPEPVNTN